MIEYYFALDILAVRITFWFVDKLIIQSDFSKVARLLNANIDLAVDGLTFGKIRALPWFDTDELAKLVSNVHRVKVTLAEGVARYGVGIIRRGTGGVTSLMTVRHVTEMGMAWSMPSVSKRELPVQQTVAYQGSDPVVELAADNCGGVDFSLATRSDLPFIRHLFVLHPSQRLTIIDDFSVNVNDSEIIASVNVRQGDSGAPVFAVLKNGKVRYIGAVSRGTFDEGHGNILSSVVVKVTAGSPGVGVATVDEIGELTDSRRKVFSAINEIQRSRQKRVHGRKKGDTDTRVDKREKQRLADIATFGALSADSFDQAILDFDAGEITQFNIMRAYRTSGAGLGFGSTRMNSPIGFVHGVSGCDESGEDSDNDLVQPGNTVQGASS